MKTITDLLGDPHPGRIVKALNSQLTQLNSNISSLRKQQSVILNLLKDNSESRKSRILDKEAWIRLLESCGLNDDERWQWHVMFEKQSPEAHQDFRESLSIPTEEIQAIREKARKRSC